MNPYERIRASIRDQALGLPIHLRGNTLALYCEEDAITIINKIKALELQPHEMMAFGQYFRKGIRAACKDTFDCMELDVISVDSDRGESVSDALSIVGRTINSICHAGTRLSGERVPNAEINNYCRSLLWLCCVGMGHNEDLYENIFGVKK